MAEIRVPATFPVPGDVRQRRVVITGASRGLGRVLMAAFVQSGARVIAVARDQTHLDRAAAQHGDAVVTCAADVSEAHANDRVVDRAVETFGGIDVFIGNAGISPIVQSPEATDPEVWKRIIDVNLTGAFFGARAASAVMEPGSTIIMTTSVIGERPRRGLAAYSASKAGLNALVKSLAIDLAPRGVTVNGVAPGWFDSPLAEGWVNDPGLHDEIAAHTVLGRWGQSEDLPGAYLFLASPAASFVTGVIVPVDGGYLLT